MKRFIEIDRAIYWVDDATRSYGFEKRNPDWADLDSQESLRNQKSIDGYTRVFKDGRKKVFRFGNSLSRKAKERRLGDS